MRSVRFNLQSELTPQIRKEICLEKLSSLLQFCVFSHVWETLAEAYYARGSFEASMRAFEQCLKLGADPTYSKFKIGAIRRHLGEEEEAIAALSQLQYYSPALVELAKTWLQIVQKKYKEGLGISVVKGVSECIKAAAK